MNSKPQEISPPKHVAIIMDGNGRWASRTGLPRHEGHQKGSESVKEAVRYCIEKGISVLTLYAFSTENWQRPQPEIDFLMNLLRKFLMQERQNILEKNIRLAWIGRRSRIPADIQTLLGEIIESASNNTGLILVLALDYGARNEISRAIRRMTHEVRDGKLNPEDIDEFVTAKYLDTAGLPDPDLLIRTSGEQRISNFLLYQSAYAELYFSEKNWPEFDYLEFDKAISEFNRRTRKFGLTSSSQTGS